MLSGILSRPLLTLSRALDREMLPDGRHGAMLCMAVCSENASLLMSNLENRRRLSLPVLRLWRKSRHVLPVISSPKRLRRCKRAPQRQQSLRRQPCVRHDYNVEFWAVAKRRGLEVGGCEGTAEDPVICSAFSRGISLHAATPSALKLSAFRLRNIQRLLR